MSYHNGSIWPHDNALIGAGLGASGRRDGVERILKALLDAAMMMDQHRLPELFCGFPRRRGRAPVLYPVACSPQAWASGALFYLLQSMLGLESMGATAHVRFAEPLIPEWLGYVELTNSQSVTLACRSVSHGKTAVRQTSLLWRTRAT